MADPCHPDSCALFVGGDNLVNTKSLVIENWIKECKTISKNFYHLVKKKKENYGFIHFNSTENKNEFYQETKDKRFHLKDDVVVQFLPVKRNRAEPHNKHDSVGRGACYYNLYDNGTNFTILIFLLISGKNGLELFVDDNDVLIINGEYREVNSSGEVIKKFIPDGKFEYKIQLPSRIDDASKVKVEQVEDNFNLYKIELKKSETNKRIKLVFD